MLYYRQINNFGDDLNPWLWTRMFPEVFDEKADSLFLGIGTILDSKVPSGPTKFVFGSGWSGENKISIENSWRFFGVRGPLTARGLGLDPRLSFSDPGLLVRRFYEHEKVDRKGIGWIPHHRSVDAMDWQQECDRYGLRFINPETSVQKVLAAIDQCEYVVTEAMHGAIIADSLRVPWIPVRMYSHINEFKWHDWCGSLQLDYDPLRLSPLFSGDPPLAKKVKNLWKNSLAPTPFGKDKWKLLHRAKSNPDAIDEVMKSLSSAQEKIRPQLSNSKHLDAAEEQQLEQLEGLRAEWCSILHREPHTRKEDARLTEARCN